jgi:hypothetical protein
MTPHIQALIPAWLWVMVAPMLAAGLVRDLDFLEVFAGQGNMTKAFIAMGMMAAQFETVHGPGQDLTTVDGLCAVIILVLRVKEGGLVWLAPPCNLFSWMSSSVHKRTKLNPAGNIHLPSVRRSNKIARIAAGLVRLAYALKVRVAVENPHNSGLFRYHPMKKALEICGAQKHFTWLGAFGCPIPKPLDIWGNARFLPRLVRRKPTNVYDAASYYEVTITGDVNGKRKLQETAVYPMAFGEFVAECYLASRPNILQELQLQATLYSTDETSDSEASVELEQ